MYLLIKVIFSAILIAFATEVVKYNKTLAAMIVSLPLMSIISFIWIYLEKPDETLLAAMSMDIFWLVLLSLPFFLAFTFLLRMQLGFWLALVGASFLLILLYSGALFIKSHW